LEGSTFTGQGRTAGPDRLNYNWLVHGEANVMSELTFEQKQGHYDKIRRSNYLASLRLEGFDTTRADADKPLPTREAVLRKYLKNPS
jgi:hypothetical protein